MEPQSSAQDHVGEAGLDNGRSSEIPPVWHPSAGGLAGSAASPFRITDLPSDEPQNGSVNGSDSVQSRQEAAEPYRRFPGSSSGGGVEVLTAVGDGGNEGNATVDLFRDVRRSSPEFADRLARASQSMPVAGSEFAGFQLVDEVGRGAFGRVFLARETELAGRQVVVKITAALPGESQTLAQLQHTNIVPIYSVRNRDPFHVLCMPYYGTTTLADVVGSLGSCHSLPVSGSYLVSTVNGRKRSTRLISDSGGPPGTALDHQSSGTSVAPSRDGVERGEPTSRRGQRPTPLQSLEGQSYVNAVLWIGARLAEGLDHAHQRGILHRDLKPANVLLTDDGQPMLLDFNLSEDTKQRSSAAAARAGGTLPYMSPEQLESFRDGRALDARSDLYSLGLVLYELLTGRHAFPMRSGSVDEVVTGRLQDCRTRRLRLRLVNPQVSPAAESIVLRCLEPDREQRYQSARDLQEDLERQLADLPLKHAPEPSWRERARKWQRRHPRLTSSTSMAVCCGVILLGCGAAFAGQMERARRLEAQDTLAGFREQVSLAKYHLNRSAPDPKQLEDGVREFNEALGRYRVLEGAALDEQPAVRDLPSDDDRTALRGEIGEALLFLTRAAVLQTQQESDAQRRRQRANFGLHLLELARAGEDNTSKVALLMSAELNRALGRDEESERQRKDAEKLEPKSAGEFYLLALRWGDRREFGRALPLLRESTRRNPRDQWAWFYQGYCHYEAAEFADAVRCCTVSIALTPRQGDAYLAVFNRGLAFARLGEFAEACADFDQALRMRPASAEVRISRGIARTEWGKYAEAIADFDDCLRNEPGMTRVYFLRATARAKAGDADGARRDRQQGLRAQPTDELSWIDRALARVDAEPAAALSDLDQALKLNPHSFLALQNKAHVLGERLDRQQDAVAVLNQEVELYPGFVRARVGRGVHLARLGRRDEALADARESLARSKLGETYYQASNIYALTSRKNPDDARQSFPLLAAALRRGFGLEFVDSDPDFEPVRKNAEFQRVVKAARELQAVDGKPDR